MSTKLCAISSFWHKDKYSIAFIVINDQQVSDVKQNEYFIFAKYIVAFMEVHLHDHHL